MNTIELTLVTLLIVCIVVLVYMGFWVGPRIDRIYKVQMSISKLVFAQDDWQKYQHLCNRDTIENLEYRLRPINMRTFLSQAEIDELTSNPVKS